MIAAAAERHGIRPELLRAIVQHESNFDENAIGDGGKARGLMQMHGGAASDMGVDWEKLFNPALALDAGAAYLAWLITELQDERTAVAAYNGGLSTMRHGSGARFYDQAVAYANTVYMLIREAPPAVSLGESEPPS